MARYFTPITIQELKIKIEEAQKAKEEDSYFDCYLWGELTSQIQKDLKKVEFDFENVTCEKEHEWLDERYADEPINCAQNQFLGYNILSNGLSFLGFLAGGDWECPVHFIIYWNGKKLRSYIPNKGNYWNTDTKQAYGNNEKLDSNNIRKNFPYLIDPAYEEDGDIQFFESDVVDYNDDDYSQMLEDIKSRIKLKD
ncbi:MAG: hypothetical protein K9J13_16180 [Saprospiraceae bacterium]|nr:hypothetical protein [Saprospiraceae bacterium]